MANVDVIISKAIITRQGASPILPGASEDPALPVNPDGTGNIPPVDGSYADQAAMIADQANQLAQYIYFDGTSYWEYLGTTVGTIADYREFSGGDFVSYDVDDGKNATEQQRARQNVGLDTGIPQIITSNGTLDLITRSSNLIIFTGSGLTELTVNGMTAGLRGERVTLVNRRSNGSPVIFTEESTAVDGNNRFSIRQTVTLLQSESIVLMYDLVRWVHYKPFIQVGEQINTNPGTVYYSGANHLPGTFSGELNTAFNMEPFSSNRRLRYNGSLLTNSFSSAVRTSSLANNSTYVVPNASAQENKIFVIYIVDTTDRTRYSYGLGVLRTGDFEPVYFIKDDGNNGDRFILNPGSLSDPGIKFRNESGGVANYAYSITFLSEAL